MSQIAPRAVDRRELVEALAACKREVAGTQRRLARALETLCQRQIDLVYHDCAESMGMCPTCMGDGVVEVGVGPAAHDVPCPGCPGTGELDREQVEMASEHAADGW